MSSLMQTCSSRYTLLRAAALGLYQAHWSEQILAEATRNLISTGRMTDGQAARLTAAIRIAFPDALICGYEELIPSMLNEVTELKFQTCREGDESRGVTRRMAVPHSILADTGVGND